MYASPSQVFGDAINLSARLMVKCKKGTVDILSDEPTQLQAKYKANYTALEPMELKVCVRGDQRPLGPFSEVDYDMTSAPSLSAGQGQARDCLQCPAL